MDKLKNKNVWIALAIVVGAIVIAVIIASVRKVPTAKANNISASSNDVWEGDAVNVSAGYVDDPLAEWTDDDMEVLNSMIEEINSRAEEKAVELSAEEFNKIMTLMNEKGLTWDEALTEIGRGDVVKDYRTDPSANAKVNEINQAIQDAKDQEVFDKYAPEVSEEYDVSKNGHSEVNGASSYVDIEDPEETDEFEE